MIVWPALLTPRSIEFMFDSRSRSGGPTLTGVEQIVGSSGGLWRARLVSIPVVSDVKRKVWRALEAQIQGRTNEVLVPVFNIDNPGLVIGGITHSDGSTFSDDTGYSQSEVTAEFSSAAALRATEITLTVTNGTIEPGHYFSVGLGRLYTVAALVSEAGSNVTVNIWPPLREAALQGAPAEFCNPTCRMRLASDDGMKAEFELGRFASPSVDFVEAL
jgi:hypothetical protein